MSGDEALARAIAASEEDSMAGVAGLPKKRTKGRQEGKGSKKRKAGTSVEVLLDTDNDDDAEDETLPSAGGGAPTSRRSRSSRQKVPVNYVEEEDVDLGEDPARADEEVIVEAEEASSGADEVPEEDEIEDEDTVVVDGKRMSKYEADRLAKIARNQVCEHGRRHDILILSSPAKSQARMPMPCA